MNTSISVGELLQKVDRGEKFLLLDVRNAEEFERWKVEGRKPVDTIHRPYFDFIEDETLLDAIPRDRGPIYAICAKGDSSDLVAGMLRERGADASNVTGGMVAYGEYLEPVRVPVAPEDEGRFEIWQMNRRGKGCLSYVVRAGRDAVVVDPSRALSVYDRFVEKLGAKIVAVFDTHVHADHISGGPAYANRDKVRYWVASGPGVTLKLPITQAKDGEQLQLGGKDGVALTVRLLSTPGHTPGSTSFLVGDRHLLTGDTLFVDSVGRPDLGGHVEEWGKMLFHTLRERLAQLSDDTIILPAHYGSAAEINPHGVVAGRLGDLRRTVPELQIRTESEFVDAMRKALKTPPAVYEKIIHVNMGDGVVSEETASEWELGKNQCAASMRRAMEAAS
ncbi:MAG TPA: MBL fold metallo-hydrolase [Thermoanaerobaculia bacterium]|nr:MBL fold metallo-hydrolase [Thermoanaerobaculia bacterium]